MNEDELDIKAYRRLVGWLLPMIARLLVAGLDVPGSAGLAVRTLRRGWPVPSRTAEPEPAAGVSAIPGGGRTNGAGGPVAAAVFERRMGELVADRPDRGQLVAAATALYRRQLERMGAELAACRSARAVERRQLARDVHDWVGNGVHLALRQLDLHAIEAARGQPRAARRLADARETLEELSVGARRLIGELRGRPAGHGLGAELRDYVARANMMGVQVTVRVTGDERILPPGLRDELFVVVREALRNALTHAGAEHVSATVEVVGSQVRASVEDDGVGLPADLRRPGRGGGVGLAAMRERVAACGGWMEIRNRSPRGTAVRLVVNVPVDGSPGATPEVPEVVAADAG